MTNKDEYVIVPQNDLQQIEQIVREYESEPAQGLTHGVQKDAIQNGIGARLPDKSEPNSYYDWKFNFELLEINGNYALSFWDEGTTGLTGEILSSEEINQWSAEGRLSEDQKLSRFLTRFESGGNTGPGSFGRGKLIFHGASKTSSIVCDSIRFDDGKYIAFERKIMGNNLKQTRMPHQGEEGKQFIRDISGGVLSPLINSGTRITILDLKDEIVESIKKSFNETISNDLTEPFEKMIEETWWEIIDKFDVKIFVKFGDKIKQVELSEPLKSIARAENNENGLRIYTKKFLPIVIGKNTYKIKELKFALFLKTIDEEFREIWIQRKRMKIGSVSKYITPHHIIQKRLCGYLVLDPALEALIENSEGTTHYGFDLRGKGIVQIRDTVRHHLDIFQQELGFRTENEHSRDQRDLLDTMKEINELAKDLGLITDFNIGLDSKDVDIIIKSFVLPNHNSKRVEINQPIGPIIFEIINKTSNFQLVSLFVNAEQRGTQTIVKPIYQNEMNLQAEERKTILVEEFQLNAEDFRYGESVLIVAKVDNSNSGNEICKVSRTIWFGRDEPPSKEEPFVITAYQPQFPRAQTRRVELTESIHNIRFKIANKTAFNAKINVDIIARKAKSQSADVQELKELRKERDFLLPAMSEREFAIEALNISNEIFGGIAEGPMNADERKCEIFFSARAEEKIQELNLIRGKNIGKKKIEFFIGIDPKGHSIFKGTREVQDSENGKLSWHIGDRASGYIFVLNTGHPSYIFAKEHGTDIKKWYIRREMLGQGYTIAVKERTFRGVAKDFSEVLSDSSIPPAEAFLTIDEIVGTALMRLGG